MDADQTEVARSKDRATFRPSISIVINTDGRAKSLEATLRSLSYLRYPNFEVCVVYGPTPDGTREMLEGWQDRVKVAPCPEKNLSMSRNIGIALAAGEIVAFIDDDAIPEPEWLNDLAAAYRASDVGAAGGFVYDHTGTAFQWRYGTVDRFARPTLDWDRPVPEMCFPYTATVPHLLGTNSSMRRQTALAVGGFDEEFDYFLDETDVLCRIVDAGWKVRQLPRAYVHHKYRASHIRTESRVIQSWYSIIKNKIYFCILNARAHHSFHEAIQDITAYIAEHRGHLDWAVSTGRLHSGHVARFEEEVERAWRTGLQLGLTGRRRFLTEETLAMHRQPFLPFEILLPEGGRRTLCFLSQQYPPGPVGGIGRYVHELARSIAAFGHHVHVITRASEDDTVDFEEGVWVHRIRPKAHPRAPSARMEVPAHIWDHSATMLAEVRKIAESRPVDAVFAPIWDCEGIAFLFDGRFRLITSLHTTLNFWLDSHGYRKSDASFMAQFVVPMLALEAELFARSDGILANSAAIIRDIEGAYGLTMRPDRLAIVPHGIDDWAERPFEAADEIGPETLRILFVGRLEQRKGIDVLLQALVQVLPGYPHVHVDIVGHDTLEQPGQISYRDSFASVAEARLIGTQVQFHGEVSDEALRGFYQACDIFVAPSRYESFGLILLEAMTFGKPVIGCKAGGMVEVVEHGVTGLLAEPGDAASLGTCLRQLIDDADMRGRLGAAGRRRYEQHFKPEHMAVEVIRLADHIVSASKQAARQASPAVREEVG